MPFLTFDKVLKIVQLVLNILLFAIKAFTGFRDSDEESTDNLDGAPPDS